MATTVQAPPPPTLMKDLGEVFDSAQKSFATHRKAIAMVQEIARKFVYEGKKVNEKVFAERVDLFFGAFVAQLHKVMTTFKREPCIERVFEFLSRLISSPPELEDGQEPSDEFTPASLEFGVGLVTHVLPFTQAADKAVRFRATGLIARVMNALGAEAELPEELFEVLLESVGARLRDRVAGVRAQAVAALGRLQDPSDENDPLTAELTRLMLSDPSPEVRKAALVELSVAPWTVEPMLSRIRDMNADVRATAFLALGEKVPPQALTIAQRMGLMATGLSDRATGVAASAHKLITRTWYEGAYEGKLKKFLDALDVEAYEPAALAALTALVNEHGVEELGLIKIISKKKLSAEDALLWRGAAQALKDNPEALEAIVPPLTELMEVFERQDKQGGAAKTLLKIASMSDASDEVGRKAAIVSLKNVLTSVLDGEGGQGEEEELVGTLGLVEPGMELLAALTRSENDFATLAGEILSELMDPSDREISDAERDAMAAATDLRMRLAELEEERATYISAGDEDRVSQLTATISNMEAAAAKQEALISPPTTNLSESGWIVSLSLCSATLGGLKGSSGKSLVSAWKSELILPAIANPSALVRNEGLRAYGLYALLVEEEAEGASVLFKNVMEADTEAAKLIALKALFDLFAVYGSKLAQEGILESLLLGLDDADSEVRTLAAEGFSRLLLAGVVDGSGSGLLSRLLILYYSPTTGSDSALQQVLAVFFPAYAGLNSACRSALAGQLIPMLNIITNAPKSSPVGKIALASPISYVIALTDGPNTDTGVHSEWALAALTDILDDPEGPLARPLARALTQTRLTATAGDGGDASSDIEALRRVTGRALKDVSDRVTGRYLTKFDAMLVAALGANGADGEAEPGDDGDEDVSEDEDE